MQITTAPRFLSALLVMLFALQTAQGLPLAVTGATPSPDDSMSAASLTI